MTRYTFNMSKIEGKDRDIRMNATVVGDPIRPKAQKD